MRTKITAVPAGRRANGEPIRRQSFIIDREPEPFGEGRSRIFAENTSMRRPDGSWMFTPSVVMSGSIEYVSN